MGRFSKFKARLTEAFYSPVLLLLLSSCAAVPSSQKYVGSVSDLKSSHQIDESFQSLWEKRTVYFGQAGMGGKPLRLSLPFMTSGERSGDSEFPLQIIATLMDSLLIEVGLKHYVSLLEMPPEEEAEFRSSYCSRYDPANHLLIWCELQTNWAELHLDLKRWTVFVEDDAGNQYELEQVLEESQYAPRITMDSRSEFQPGIQNKTWGVNRKKLMLCFPKFDFYQKPVLSDMTKSLKLVFQLSDDPRTRSEGIWMF